MNSVTLPKPVYRGLRTGLKALALGVTLMAVLWGSSIAWLPWLVKREIVALGSEKLGRAVSVADVQFSPWSLTLSMDGLAVAAVGGGIPQLSVKRIVVTAAIDSLWRIAPVVDAITVDAPQLRLTRQSHGGYDIDDILARLVKSESTKPEKPVLFALYNLLLTEGTVDFADQDRVHTLRNLHIAIPFLSNLPSQRTVNVSPRLTFVLNGSHFDSAAEGTPFAQTRKTEATLKVEGLDFKPYLPYLPATLPFKLQAGLLDVDVKLGFEQVPDTRVRLGGMVAVHKLNIATPASQPLLALDSLTVGLSDVRPLEKIIKLEAIEVQAPHLTLQREADGQLQWPRTVATAIAVPHRESTPKSTAENGQLKNRVGSLDVKSTPSAWQVELKRFLLTDGALTWVDTSIQPKANLGLNRLTLQATNLAWPMKQAVPFHGVASMDGTGAPGQFTINGTASLHAAHITATVADLPIAVASSYLSPYLVPRLQGQLNSEFGLDWKAEGNDLSLSIPKLTLTQLALVDSAALPVKSAPKPSAGKVLASVQRVELTSTTVQLSKQEVSISAITVKNPNTSLARDADLHWMFERWLKTAVSEKPVKTAKTVSQALSPIQAAPLWRVVIADLGVEGGAINFSDKANIQPVQLDMTAIKLNLKNISTGNDKSLPLNFSANIAAGQQAPGSLAVRGALTLVPLALTATVDAKRLPVHAVVPYAAGLLNLEMVRADTSYLGQVQFRQTPLGPQIALKGDLNVEDFHANSQVDTLVAERTRAQANGTAEDTSNTLLSWKALAVRGLTVKLMPNAATQVGMKETVLSDFFARLILHENGRLNLQDLVNKGPVLAPSAPPAPPMPPGGVTSPHFSYCSCRSRQPAKWQGLLLRSFRKA